MKLLSVVVVNYRNPPLLRLFLRSLGGALPAGVETEVIVVDSASTPETRNVVNHDMEGKFRSLTLVPFAENTGYTRGVNEGLRRANGAWILNLNPDIVPLPGSITALLDHGERDASIGMLGPRLDNFDGTRQDSCFRFYTPATMALRRLSYLPGAGRALEHFVMKDTDLSVPRDVDWLMGSALLIRRAALDNAGLLDERLFHYCSDDDLARRMWQSGWRVIYCPSARMLHWHQRQSKGRLGILDLLLRRQGRWHLRDAVRYFAKHGAAGTRP